MRTIIVTCSLAGAASTFLLSTALNGLSGFGFDYSVPYNEPVRVVATLLGAAPGFIAALVGLGYALYDAARRSGVGWFIGLLAWPFVPVVAASLMFAGALSYAIYWFLPLTLVPLAPLMYALVALMGIPAPADGKPVPASWGRLAVFVGVLVVVVLGGGVLLYPRPQSGGNGASLPPALQVTQGATSADCANGSYPTVTLKNSGSQPLQWLASSKDPSVTASPSSGGLDPGGSVAVSLSGTTSAPDVIVQFLANGQGAGVAKFGCQAGAGK